MNKRARSEFGDFQTPLILAREVCALVQQTGFAPASIVEPTCGRGVFLIAALEAFPTATHLLGVDRREEYAREAKQAVTSTGRATNAQILQGDFFALNWEEIVGRLPEPLLILGNPPWVTNSSLGGLGSNNRPRKANSAGLRGIEAITGKSNFDISEWMLLRNLEWLDGRDGMLAVLCKTSVARKVLATAWAREFMVREASMYRIDAKANFGAVVDACLLVVQTPRTSGACECRDYSSLSSPALRTVFGPRGGAIVSDIQLYDHWHDLRGQRLGGWRSGIKHDCAKVFELVRKGAWYENGFGARVDLEAEVLFPLLKSSDLVNRRHPRKWLLVPQKTLQASLADMEHIAPKSWRYLAGNEDLLAKRGSSIYRNRHRFSIFGVGAYSFAPWKVAISGMCKKLEFVQVPPFEGLPVVLDDTGYFFPCQSAEECSSLHALVESRPAQEFLSSLIFWDSKRPVTASVLNTLDLAAVARVAGLDDEITRTLAEKQLNGGGP